MTPFGSEVEPEVYCKKAIVDCVGVNVGGGGEEEDDALEPSLVTIQVSCSGQDGVLLRFHFVNESLIPV